MDISEAISLIQNAVTTSVPQTWADLGCGGGTFTFALLKLLPKGSSIVAIDKEMQSFNEEAIHFYKLDFTKNDLPKNNLDGIMLANSLHYVKEKPRLLRRLKEYLGPTGTFIIIEYDIKSSNPWVPYPVTAAQLPSLFYDLGYKRTRIIAEKTSIFNEAKIYVAEIKH